MKLVLICATLFIFISMLLNGARRRGKLNDSANRAVSGLANSMRIFVFGLLSLIVLPVLIGMVAILVGGFAVWGERGQVWEGAGADVGGFGGGWGPGYRLPAGQRTASMPYNDTAARQRAGLPATGRVTGSGGLGGKVTKTRASKGGGFGGSSRGGSSS